MADNDLYLNLQRILRYEAVTSGDRFVLREGDVQDVMAAAQGLHDMGQPA